MRFLRLTELLYILTVLVVTKPSFVKTQKCTLKRVKCTLCQLYLNKSNFKQRTLLQDNHLAGLIKKKGKGRNKYY